MIRLMAMGGGSAVIADLIRYHDFDIFGTQEGKFHQVEELKNKLRGYDYIGVGRDDGIKRGEFTAIYYKTDRFELLDEGNFWLSSTPDYPSLGCRSSAFVYLGKVQG